MSSLEAVDRALARDGLPPDMPWMDSLVTRAPLSRPHVRTRGEGFLVDYHESLAEAAPASIQQLVGASPATSPLAGWAVHKAGTDGSWLRLEKNRSGSSRKFLEVQRSGGLLRWALLTEPRGLPAHLASFVSPPRFR